MHYGFLPHLSVYSDININTALKKLKECCPMLKNLTKTNSAQVGSHFPNLPLGWGIAFPIDSAVDFIINSIPGSSDYNITVEPWESVKKIIKLHSQIKLSGSNGSVWIQPEDIIPQTGEEYYVVKRVKVSNIISKFNATSVLFNKNFVYDTVRDSSIINSNVPVFLFTYPEKYPLDIGLAKKNQLISYSNIDTNMKCLQSICESTFIALSQASISRYKGDCELTYTDNIIFYNKTIGLTIDLSHDITNIYDFLELYISFPSKFYTVLEYNNDAILHIDPLNHKNFLYKVPRTDNRFHFTHSSMPLCNSNIRPPFLLQMQNSYNNHNIEINGKNLSCLAILQERKNTNMLDILETYQTRFFPSPNQYLQFVITDNKNNIINLHPNSLIIVSIFTNNT